MTSRAALVHSQTEFSNALAEAIAGTDADWRVDDLSTLSRSDRIRHLLTGNYDLIQADETLGNGVLAAVAGTLTDTEVVVCLRGWGDMTNAHGQYGRLREASIRARSKAVLAAASRTMTLGTQTQRELGETYERGVQHAESVPRPLDVDAFRPGQPLEPNGGTPTELLTVTNLRYEEKLRGVETILDGIGPVLSDHPELTYRIAGGGRHLPALEATVSQHPSADQIDVLGFRDDVPELLADADVFLYASYLDAYPTVVLEAQAAGLPVVAADASGVPDVVDDAGLICESTPDAIEAATRRVVEDADLRNSLAERSRNRMADYNETAAHRYVEVWEDALDGGHRKTIDG